ncbi:FAD-dependent thymidylate synthase [Heliobacterium chlorum]|uniref:FAD-dependent thymidylate synthase n=1 Tax=Heliobacterium chlorum TaxID=2698 RepID=A0ABR7T8L0_HELCL|nr:FAD-dependent thymidylate synthase [Heliobacterium chlorum]MBC9786487.1 FAD-dependent thymidylate synthase [Heliobacterium chlorum]
MRSEEKGVIKLKRFSIDLNPICWNERVHLEPERIKDIRQIEHFINENYVEQGFTPIQHGRVIALRSTDKAGQSSAFASALYLGKYDDMGNTNRFLNGMVKAGHSYEPIRGETVTFLYIGVSKTAYDHLITYTIRNRRIAGGFRANKPWGLVVPNEAKDPWIYHRMMEEQLARCERLRKEHPEESLQAIRSLYPMGVMMPPFMLDFSEEALVKNVFKQRIWERGAQGETRDIVNSMFEAVSALDPQKWDTLREYHGLHIEGHNRAMRKLREQRPTLRQLVAKNNNAQADIMDLDVYELLMDTVGKLPKTMWDKAS